MVLYFWMMVQIICESLPISSSGHVALLQKIIQSFYPSLSINQDLWAFDYFLQGMSAIVIFIYFFPRWWQLIVNKPMRISSLLNTHMWKTNIFPVIIFGFITDAITFLFWALHVADYVQIPLAIGFMITGAALWSMQFARENKQIDMWCWKYALIVGCVQGCALFAGVSRFGTTVAVLQWLGYSGRLAFAISFLVQWPLIVAGSLLGIWSLQDASVICTVPFILTTLISGCIAYVLLGWVGKLIDKNLLWKFSYYMIIPSVIALLI